MSTTTNFTEEQKEHLIKRYEESFSIPREKCIKWRDAIESIRTRRDAKRAINV
jgi:hypothetical protein